jgi:phosphate-selective porin OprO and OprP
MGCWRNRIGWWCLAVVACARPAGAADWEDWLQYRSPDERFSIRLGGRLQLDAARIEGDSLPSAQTEEEIRRGRLSLSGKAFGDWRFRYEQDFASDEDTQIKDAWIGYRGLDRFSIRAGNQQEPVSLEELTSSNAITFMERTLPNALVSGYYLGLLAQTWGDDWTTALGLFEGRIRGREDDVDQGWGLAGRAVYAPVNAAGQRLHAGLSVEYREPPGNRRIAFSTLPEIDLAERRLLSTGTLSDVDHTLTSGIELAGIWGPWSLQGEYLRTDVRRTPREDVAFRGWYLFGSWFVAGGQRAYDPKSGIFVPVRPTGQWGALELAARYSTLNLDDGPITGGTGRNWTLGLNWYINYHTRIMVNWVDAQADPNRDGDRESIQAIQSRFQFFF